ncbi:hypothetical protein C5167_015163 [Papaver somniferum]|uniref:Pentatricopeptide repeat-containing protein n=1 Tax=Papaver somniferum TaxID=3469 RepID=A0A4Y7J578_PAPSO|nr:hypothetical protein C5167_015163 [Papaver somniferum]
MRNQESPIVLSVSQTQNFPSLLKPVVRSLSLLPVIRRFLFHGYLDHHVNLGDVLHDLQICFGFQGRSVANFFGTKNKLQFLHGFLNRAKIFEAAAKLMKEMSSKGFQYDLITYSYILKDIRKVGEDNIDAHI